MYTIDMETTKFALDELEKNPEKLDRFLEKFKNKKIYPNVKFGQAFIFFTIYLPWI